MAKRSNALSGSGGRGGGPGSKSLSGVTTYYGGRPSDRVSPGGVSQVGSNMGNHSTDGGGKVLRGAVEPMMSGKLIRPGQPEMGNNCGDGGWSWRIALGVSLWLSARGVPSDADWADQKYFE
jgi:hypothetical protein